MGLSVSQGVNKNYSINYNKTIYVHGRLGANKQTTPSTTTTAAGRRRGRTDLSRLRGSFMAETCSRDGANRVRSKAAEASLILIRGACARSTGSSMCSSSSRDLACFFFKRNRTHGGGGGGEEVVSEVGTSIQTQE